MSTFVISGKFFSIKPFIKEHEKEYRDFSLLEKMVEPDRIIAFKIPFEYDDGHKEEFNAYRVQFNNVLGPYKGGLRFHETVNESILKFLAFEQIFKNSLTGLPIGVGSREIGYMRERYIELTGLVDGTFTGKAI